MGSEALVDLSTLAADVYRELTLAGLAPHKGESAGSGGGVSVAEHEDGVLVLWEVHRDMAGPTTDTDELTDTTSQPVLCRRARAAMHHALQEILAANGHRVMHKMSDGLLVVS